MKQLIISTILAVVALLPAGAAEVVDGVAYTLRNGNYIVSGWDEDNPSPKIHILGEVNGLDVVAIDAWAFADNTTLEYVIIDEGITSIGYNAFDRCAALKQVLMPEGLETIGEEAFAFCSALSTVVVPSTVIDIASHAFWQCTGVTDAYFLMDEVETLERFGWWDGVFPQPGEDEHGGMEFNTVEHTVLHVPQGMLDAYVESGKFEAWLGHMHEDDGTYPLWWIVNYGTVGRSYTVADPLLALHVDVNGDLYAKDDNRWLMPDKIYDGEVDYMSSTDLMSGRTYDQSNWVLLRGVEAPQALLTHWLDGGTITGTLADCRNPVIEVTEAAAIQAGSEGSYEPNVYIPAALMGRTQQGADEVTYAFVQPKPYEIVTIDWAVCADDYGTAYAQAEFYMPLPDGESVNPEGLSGGFSIDDALYESTERPDLLQGETYHFGAIVRLRAADDEQPSSVSRRVTPYAEGGLTERFQVFPLSFDEGVVTGLRHIQAASAASSNAVYDLQGRRVAYREAPGIYIHNGRKIAVAR